VRELETTVARLVALRAGGSVDLEQPDQPDEPEARAGAPSNLRAQVEAFERGLVEQALRGAAGNHSEAARRLGMSRVTLLDKLKKYGL
jgi:two-component system response regulator HydG